MPTNRQKKQKTSNKVSLKKGFQKIEDTFKILFTSRFEPFLVAMAMALSIVIVFMSLDLRRAVFMAFLFLMLELIVCESSLKRVRFFQIHWQYRRTFYFILVLAGLLNILAARYIGYESVAPFLGVSLITVLLGRRAGQISSIFFASIVILLFPGHTAFGFYLIVTGYLTAQLTRGVDRRIELTLHALIISGIKAVGFLLLIVSNYEMFSIQSLVLVSITPIISTIVVIGMLPYIEWFSRIYSNIGMLELGNLSHPLLNDLMHKASGTYYHSFMLSNLSEAAAEKINANPILARIGAYFHDIGKAKKPSFFTENQSKDNPHDRINPSMSYLILTEHVKFGGELARKYRLPILFEDLIYQHHGTRVQKFFYSKAKSEDTATSDDQYRYAGPRPQFKEAGILMLADSCEAAVKSLENPTPQKIKELVQEIVNNIYLERELDDSGLTLRELEVIIQEFTKVIVKSQSKRIKYPKEEGNNNEVAITGETEENKIE